MGSPSGVGVGLGVVGGSGAPRRSAMVTSPAPQWVVGTSRMTTRMLSTGASTASAAAWVSAEIRVRSCSGVRPSTRVTSMSGMRYAFPPLRKTEPRLVKCSAVLEPGRREHGIRHAAGEHDPAGLDGVAAAGQVVGGERERLAGVALHGRAGRRVDDDAADLDEHGLEREVELGRAAARSAR